MVSKIGRRDFLVGSTAAIAGIGLTSDPGTSHAQNQSGKSRIVEVVHKSVVSSGRKIDEAAVKLMLAKGMEKFAKSPKPWSKFVKPGDRVGLKINTLGRPLIVTHHELLNAIIKELVAAGIKENDIIVWDRFEDHMTGSKFKINSSASGVRYMASESGSLGSTFYDPKTAYSSGQDRPERRDEKWGVDSPVSKLFVDSCDKIINVPVLKDHGIAGATLCLKNIAYGITCNNSRFHGRDHIDTFIADVCAINSVKDKVVLHIVDGLEGCFNNGPLPRDMGSIFKPQTLWFGTDPVALDTVAIKVIEAKRKEKGLPPFHAIGRPATHIRAAAKKGVGVDNPKLIKVTKINL